MQLEEALSKLKSLSNPDNVEGMVRFGINPQKTFGITVPILRKMAKEIGRDHGLALQLWDSGYHEARILASMIDDYKQVNEGQMDEWVADFDSWDVCDQTIMNLFEDMGVLAWKKAVQWSEEEEEFIKRAGFVMMARLAVSDKKTDNQKFLQFFPLIIKQSIDNRNFVKKAVNWALRQIGKRNLSLNKKAIEVAKEILSLAGDLPLSRESGKSKTAKWIAKDAIRELESEAIQKRL